MSRDVELLPGESIDQLERKGYRIIQKSGAFRFGMDAVLLSAFARVLPGEAVMDLGTGTGILPILMEARCSAGQYVAVEIQKEMAEMAERSVHLNGLEDRISVFCGDLCQASSRFGKACFDVVTSNPPYMKQNQGMASPNSGKAAARHELFCTLGDVVREASLLLKPGGRFYLVHRPERLAEIFCELHSRRLEPKRMRLVYPSASQEANLVLMESIRGGNSGMKTEPPLIVYKSPGVYTDEIFAIYRE